VQVANEEEYAQELEQRAEEMQMNAKKKHEEHTAATQDLDKRLTDQRLEEVEVEKAKFAELQAAKDKDAITLKEQNVAIEAHVREIARLSEVEKSLKAEMKLNDEHTQRNTELEAALTKAQATITAEEAKRSTWESEQEEANTRINEHTSKLEELTKAFARSSEKAEMDKRQLVGLERQLEKVDGVLETTRVERDQLAAGVAGQTAAKEEAKAESESLKEQLEKVNKILVLTRSELHSALEEGEQAQETAGEFDQASEELQRKLGMRELELETTEKFLFMSKEKETKTAEKLAETEKDLGDKLTNTQRQLELARVELEAAIEQKEYYEEMSETVKKERDEIKEELDEMEMSLDKALELEPSLGPKLFPED